MAKPKTVNKGGRPSLGDLARNKLFTIRVTEAQEELLKLTPDATPLLFQAICQLVGDPVTAKATLARNAAPGADRTECAHQYTPERVTSSAGTDYVSRACELCGHVDVYTRATS